MTHTWPIHGPHDQYTPWLIHKRPSWQTFDSHLTRIWPKWPMIDPYMTRMTYIYNPWLTHIGPMWPMYDQWLTHVWPILPTCDPWFTYIWPKNGHVGNIWVNQPGVIIIWVRWIKYWSTMVYYMGHIGHVYVNHGSVTHGSHWSLVGICGWNMGCKGHIWVNHGIYWSYGPCTCHSGVIYRSYGSYMGYDVGVTYGSYWFSVGHTG